MSAIFGSIYIILIAIIICYLVIFLGAILNTIINAYFCDNMAKIRMRIFGQKYIFLTENKTAGLDKLEYNDDLQQIQFFSN